MKYFVNVTVIICGHVLIQVVKTSDRRLKHLTAAADELSKVETEVNKFNQWKDGARSELLRQEECLQR